MNKKFFDETKDRGDSLQNYKDNKLILTSSELSGLSEEELFKAIVAIGNARYELKDIYVKYLNNPNKPTDLTKQKELEGTMYSLYQQQLMLVNDACTRFRLVHPEMIHPPKDKDPNVRYYWDWYSEWHQKIYHTSVNPKSDAEPLIQTKEYSEEVE